MGRLQTTLLVLALCWGATLAVVGGRAAQAPSDQNRVQPASEHPRYWEYEGEPVLLIGGSIEDNLFQVPNLEAHLDTLTAAGGTYVRNTMSARDEGNVRPFQRRADGRYDLDVWNPEYWERLDRFLQLTAERDIIVQVELWDQWDHLGRLWSRSPWNPAQNVNYDPSAVTLGGDGHYTNVRFDSGVPHDLFLTVPALQNDTTVLAYQRAFVDKVLAHTLPHDHVLYTVTNELFPQHPTAWSRHWTSHLRQRAAERGTEVEVTEMFLAVDVQADQHRASLDHPGRFDYVELSQNAHQTGQTHWEKLQWARGAIADAPRPINHVKVYGGAVGWTDGAKEGIDRWWRNLIGGAASTRFHRPEEGIGLSPQARAHLRSARMLTAEFDLFAARPDAEHRRLSARANNEAYLAAIPDQAYAVYFPDGGSVRLRLPEPAPEVKVRWLNLSESTWAGSFFRADTQRLPLKTPGSGDWVGLVKVIGEG